MIDETPQPSIASRVIIILASGLLFFTFPWTLQAFVPEPYFLRMPDQLKAMSTPNGFGEIQRSLSPFYFIICIELVVLLTLAVLGWHFRSRTIAVAYLIAVIAMAGITFLRLSESFQGLH